MIKAIIFDCFGVLVADALRSRVDEITKTDPSVGESMYGIMRRFDLNLISSEQADIELAATLKTTVEEIVDFMAKGEVRNAALIEAIPPFKLDYKLGLLSNIQSRERLESHFLRGELDKLFDQVIASGDVGMIKPNPAIYRLMAVRLGVDPAECVMIDDRDSCIDGARGVGMRTIKFLNNQQALADLQLLIDNRGETV